MSRFVHIALVSLVSALCSAAQARTVRSIPEAKTLTHADFVSPVDFELRGILLSAPTEYRAPSDRSIVIEQNGQRLMLHTSKERPVKIPAQPGDTVVLRGQTEFRNGIYDRFRIDNVETLEHGAPPPPEHATVEEILGGFHNLKIVTVRGEMSAVFNDEIDDNWHYCILSDGRHSIHLAVRSNPGVPAWTRDLPGATIEATGLCCSFFGLRRFIQPGVRVDNADAIRILRKAPDPFNVPELEDTQTMPIADVLRLGRRKVRGQVLAAWEDDHLLVKTPDGRVVRTHLSVGADRPDPGDIVEVAGTVTTDFFRLNLADAVVRKAPYDTPSVAPEPVISEKQFAADMMVPRNKALYLGRTVRASGTVERIQQTGGTTVRINIDTGYAKMTAVADARSTPPAEVEIGSRVEVTGAFVTDGDNWHPDVPFPRIGEWFVVLRSPADVKVLARPPWWTPRRLLGVIAVLLAALAGFVVWNRALRHLANRRGRELYREQIALASAQLRVDERTQLAAELHDSLSQNLSGIACQINVAKLTAGDGETKKLLATAERMLQSSRTELTRCISDLRCDTLEEPDFDAAIKKNLELLALPATIHVRFSIPRARVSDSTAHAILCIVRELVSNAVRHGKARTVKVAGSIDNTCLAFSVRDDGTGFEVASRRGVSEGHFGLAGIQDRVNRLDGSFDIRSAPGKGTVARVTIPLLSNKQQPPNQSSNA
ncbi:MAG: hypothetical protein II863_02135 [Kiritimatiellae bacterium]|nr:hypothetical protein [Kiritimatiellia bacterium]